MAVANGKHWYVIQEGLAIAGPLDTENLCLEWLQDNTPFSWDHAVKHEGYRIEERDTVTFNGHVCVREPETGGRGRIWRCVSCHGRDGWYAATCELWTGVNNCSKAPLQG